MAKTEKKAQAKIVYLDSQGAPLGDEHDKEENAHGVSYTQLSNGKTVELMPTNPEAVRMLAMFGLKTKAGHIASQVRQKSGDTADSIPAIAEWFDLVNSGKAWIDRTREAVTYELDKLAAAAVDFLIEDGKKAADQRDATYAQLLQKMTENDKMVPQVLAIGNVRERYNELVGKVKPVKTADDLLKMID